MRKTGVHPSFFKASYWIVTYRKKYIINVQCNGFFQNWQIKKWSIYSYQYWWFSVWELLHLVLPWTFLYCFLVWGSVNLAHIPAGCMPSNAEWLGYSVSMFSFHRHCRFSTAVELTQASLAAGEFQFSHIPTNTWSWPFSFQSF